MAEYQTRAWPLVASTINGPTIAAYGPMLGGYIQNPSSAEEQNVSVPEPIFLSIVGPAALRERQSTITVYPGYSFVFPGALQGNIYVNAATPGHRISGCVIQYDSPDVPTTGTFPPSTYTTLTKVLGSYLYQQYNDDNDLQAFVDSYNRMAQQYVTWFATVMLPVYTNPNVNGALLDYVAKGLYGQSRPSLPSGLSQSMGALNTIQLNSLPLDGFLNVQPSDFYLTDDDVFRRILTWHLWKGDTKLFNIRWLKRRIKRFLTGLNGTAGQTDTTYDVSISFGPTPTEVNINLQSTRRVSVGGALLNVSPLNGFMLNDLQTEVISLPSQPMSPIFKAAVDAGVLELPFQFTYTVNIN